MHRTFCRALATAVVLALLFPTSAPAATRTGRLTISTTARELVLGQSWTISGIASPAKQVRLQRRTGDTWQTVSTKAVVNDRYRFTWAPPAGSLDYRVVKPPTKRYARGVSDTVRVLVRTPVNVGIAAKPLALTQGERLRFRGTVSRGRAGEPVILQRYSAGAWRPVARDTIDGDRAYRFSVKPAAGTHRYRVFKPPTSALTSAVSQLVTSRVAAPCPPLEAPAGTTAAWFGRPGADGPSRIAEGVRRAVCAAAPGATVEVSLFYVLDEGSRDATRILLALRSLARSRNVTVRFVLERHTDQAASRITDSIEELRQWARVTVCVDGCRSRRDSGIQHNKFVVVSDTLWKVGIDPVVIQSSANWSRSQLRRRYQSAVMIHDDPTLARDYGLRFASLRACGSKGGCAGWNDLAPLGYTIHRRNRIWYDDLPIERGNLGTGRQVTFSPWPVGDPLAERLNSYACVPGHDTVRVAQMFVTTNRADFISALAGLRQRGCDVRVVVSSKEAPNYRPGIRAMREAGLEVSCLPRHHDKFILIDAVGTASLNGPERVLWSGSPNIGENALRRNDESMLEVSSSRLRPSADNERVWERYRDHYRDMAAQDGACFD